MNHPHHRRLYQFVLVALSLMLNLTASRPAAAEEEGERIAAFFEKAFDDELSRSPMMQSYLGIKTNYGEWDDLSEGARQREYLINSQLLTTLRTDFDFSKLSDADKLSFRIFERRCEQAIEDYAWRFHSYPVNQMRGRQSSIPAFLINIHRVTSVKDAEAYVSRLRGVRPLMAQVVGDLDTRRKKNIIAPAFVFPLVIDDCRNLLVGKPFDESEDDCTLLADFKKKVAKLEVSDVKKEQLIADAEKALKEDLQPAYEQLIAFTEELSESATNDHGAWKFPNGAAYYRHALRKMTTTDLTPAEIHEIGLAEMARIHSEMRGIMKQVDFKGSLQEFFEFTRTDPQFYLSNDEKGRAEHLRQATALIDTMRDRLDDLFLTKPKAPMIVKRVEAFREKSAGKAFYQSPAPDGSRPGTYYANLYEMSEMPTYQMEALAYHEGIPGHHMQLSIAQELESVPRFRRFGTRVTAYSEGWGLYTELIPKEIGFYSDPYSDFGRLSMELWRAARLVVDTGLHFKRWTREVGFEDFLQLSRDFGRETEDAASDLDRDGDVDFQDFLEFSRNFGKSKPAVPESALAMVQPRRVSLGAS